MSLREVVRRVAAYILPWPQRGARRASIAAAKQNAARSRRQADRAELLSREIRSLATDNHFADAIARQIMEGK